MAATLRLLLCCTPLILFHWMLVAPVARGDSQDYDFDEAVEDSANVQPILANETLEITQKVDTNQSFEQSSVPPTRKIHRLVLISILLHSKSNKTNCGHTRRPAKKILVKASRSLRRKRSEDRYRHADAEARSGEKSSRYPDSVNGGRALDTGSGNRGSSDLNNFDPYERLFLTADQRSALLDTVTDTQRPSSFNSKTGYETYSDGKTGTDHDYYSGYRHNNRDEYRYRNEDTYNKDRQNNEYSRNSNDRSYYGTGDRHTYQTDRYKTESNHNLYYSRENARLDNRYSYNNDNGRHGNNNDRNYRSGQSRSNNNGRYSSRDDSYSFHYNDRNYPNDHDYGYDNFRRGTDINNYQNKDKTEKEYTSYYDRYGDNFYDKNRNTKYDQSRHNVNTYDNNRSRYSDRSSTENHRNRYNSYTNGGSDYRRNSDNKQDAGDRYSSRYSKLYDDRRSSNSHYDRYYTRDTDRGNTGRSQYDRHRQTGSDSYNQDSYWKQHEQKPAYPDTLYNELSLPSSNRRYQDYSSDDYRSSSSGSGSRQSSSYSDRQRDRQNDGYYNDDYSYLDNSHSSSGNSGKKREYKRSYKHKSASSRQYLDPDFGNNTEQDGKNGSQESPRQQPYLEAFNIHYDMVPYNTSKNRSSEDQNSTSGYEQYELLKQRALFNVKTRFKRQAPEQYNAGYYNQPQFHNSFQNGRTETHQRLSYSSPSADGHYAPYLRSGSYSEQNVQPDYSNYQNAYRTNQQHYDQRAYYNGGSFNHQNPYGRGEYANYDTSGHERSLTPYYAPSTYQQTPQQSNRYQTYPDESRYSAYQNPEYNPYSHSIGSYGNQAGTQGGYGNYNGNSPKQGIAYTSQHLLQPHQRQGQEYSPYYDNSQNGLYNSRERGGYSPYDQSQGSRYGTYDQRQMAYDPHTPGGQDNPYARSPYQAQQNFPGTQGYQGHPNSEYSPYSYAR